MRENSKFLWRSPALSGIYVLGDPPAENDGFCSQDYETVDFKIDFSG